MTPFRIVVFGEREVIKGKGKRSRTEREGFAFVLWNPDEETATREGRPGFGSFAWYEMPLARRAALDALLQPEITQVSIRTNQDRQIARLYKSKLDEYLDQSKLPFAA